jgi:hypothetical protein
MMETLTAEKFLEITRNSKSISVGENTGTGGIFVVVKYHSDEHEDDLVKTFEGPNPSSIEYHVYMGLLGEIYSIPGLSGFVEGYIKKHLRLLGRMTK